MGKNKTNYAYNDFQPNYASLKQQPKNLIFIYRELQKLKQKREERIEDMLETPKLLFRLNDKRYLVLYMLLLATLLWLTLQTPGTTAPMNGSAPGGYPG